MGRPSWVLSHLPRASGFAWQEHQRPYQPEGPSSSPPFLSPVSKGPHSAPSGFSRQESVLSGKQASESLPQI